MEVVAGLIMLAFFYVLVWGVPMYLCHYIAEQKGRKPTGWVMLAFVIGWIAVLVIGCSHGKNPVGHGAKSGKG